MIYNNREYRHLTFAFDSNYKINEIVQTLEQVNIEGMKTDSQKIKYAVLEMINNSLRAHIEHKINDPVLVHFKFNNSCLTVRVEDKGMGFDPECLPYSLDEDIEKIDIHSDAFKKYQEENNYMKFGMGLYMVKMISDNFELNFIDNAGNQIAWRDGKVSGTVITIRINEEKDEPKKN